MQGDIWSISAPSEGTLPLTPPLPSVVELLSHIGQVEKSVETITTHITPFLQTDTTSTSLDDLSSSNKQVAYSCNELAALSLRVIKGSPCPQTQGYVYEVQQLSHEIARAGKTVNHVIKRGTDEERGKKRREMKKKPVQIQVVKINENVETAMDERIVPVVDMPTIPVCEELSGAKGTSESRTSMATGQLTQSPEHRVNGSKDEHVTIGRDMYSSIIDDEDDSTLV